MLSSARIESRPIKRKRPSADQRLSKRVRSDSSEIQTENEQDRILLLEKDILASKKNYNSIATLIQIFGSTERDLDSALLAGVSLCRIFTRLLVTGSMSKQQKASEKAIVVVKWLKDQYLKYKKILTQLLSDDDLSSTALSICMKLLKIEGQNSSSSTDYEFPTPSLHAILRVLVNTGEFNYGRNEFAKKYVDVYDDIRFYTFEAIEKILKAGTEQLPSKIVVENCLEILTSVQSVPESNEDLKNFYISEPPNTTHALYSLSQHKKRSQATWLALMQLGIDKSQRKTMLKLMADSIAPWFNKPELLMDFLTDSYNAGGSTSLLALSGVFYLIQQKNLDYPFIDRNFFRLLDTFLGSTHLPAALVASFLKRISRLALAAPPSGIVAVIPWVYNLLKKHPTCTFMIHREIKDSTTRKKIEMYGANDPFKMEQEDPMETNAIESSLWEISMLQSHYHPNIATLAKIISEQFTKQSYNMEDFLDHSYGSMLEAENCKEIKKIPVIEFRIPKVIFTGKESETDTKECLIERLWRFS
ncbi:CBF/Mak21 family protein [Blumeria hordei DH14]|uniref:CBF/Mak21 family protein n=1 Tax=Blumeria graminis f. sp. hordei (strain DH14) TaxID=546991 RepID=N1JGL2_BLUG1|nr:CBF/Mak21 family protein [Blumeria hordei DH14]